MSFNIPQCPLCKHFNRNADTPACTAFPDGIPKEIAKGEFDHREKHPGDGGVRFEQAKDRMKWGG